MTIGVGSRASGHVLLIVKQNNHIRILDPAHTYTKHISCGQAAVEWRHKFCPKAEKDRIVPRRRRLLARFPNVNFDICTEPVASRAFSEIYNCPPSERQNFNSRFSDSEVKKYLIPKVFRYAYLRDKHIEIVRDASVCKLAPKERYNRKVYFYVIFK